MNQTEEWNLLGEEKVSSKLIFDGHVVHLYVDSIRLPDGKLGEREYMKHIGAVCVIPLHEDGTVSCVRQCRYPFGEILTEIPAGKLDSKQEDHAKAALRELREETGLSCKKLTHLGPIYTSPAILDEVIDCFLAEELSLGETDFDDDEFISGVTIPLDDLVDQVQAGALPDAKTQIAVMRVADLLRRRKDGRA